MPALGSKFAKKKRPTKIYKIICIKVDYINVLHPLGLNTCSSVGFTLVTRCTTYPKKCLYPGSILLVACMFFSFLLGNRFVQCINTFFIFFFYTSCILLRFYSFIARLLFKLKTVMKKCALNLNRNYTLL